jgi:hypothetical protein
MRMMNASQLIEDFDLYPRNDVGGYHVGTLASALKAGAELPPLLIDKTSNKIIDGFHRRRAHIKVYGPDCKVPCVLKTYPSESAMFAEAARLNGTHGRALTECDRVRVVVLGNKFGMDESQLCTVLNCLPEDLERLRTRVAKDNGSEVPLKQTIKHMSGKTLSKKQVDANKRLSGMNQLFYVNQLITLIENDLLEKDNEKLMERLKVLKKLI